MLHSSQQEKTRRHLHKAQDLAVSRYALQWGNVCLEEALLLFTGREYSEIGPDLPGACAGSVGGVCVYLDSLQELSDNRQRVGRVHVIPGSIEWNERPFYSVEDWENSPSEQQFLISDEFIVKKLEDPARMCNTRVGVRETLRSIQIRYEILDERDRPVQLFVGPLRLTFDASSYRGLVHCPEEHRMQSSEARDVIPPELVDELNSKGVKWRMLRAPVLGRCAAMAHYKNVTGERALLREDECLACCVEYVLKTPVRELVIISRPEGMQNARLLGSS
jgi:hypothetical protein